MILLEDIQPKLYFLSQKDMDKEILHPRIPNNKLTRNGEEENKTPRVCFSKSIDGSLVGITGELTGEEFYVYMADESYTKPKIKYITNKEVPDQSYTDEVWILNDVKLKCIGSILVTYTEEYKVKFKDGYMTNNRYKWKWINKK